MFFPIKDENPTEINPILTYLLIIINATVFIYSIINGKLPEIAQNWGMIPKEIVAGENIHKIFTSMFIHGGIFHALGNIWFLFIFGDNIEDLFGRSEFLVIYFLSGIIAAMAHIALNPGSTRVTIGASGAISGILGAYMVKYPRAKVLTLVYWLIIKVPSIVFLGVWILMQFVYASYTVIAGVNIEVAYWAHVGGFVAGVLLALTFPERENVPRRRHLSYNEDFL
ncbi:MAG: rhomboid family intramembrane serine protease [Candidatus Hadarchaeia archaeon]